MSDRLRALREKRGQLVHDMRALIETAEREQRDMRPEELVQHETIFKEADEVRKQIEAEERTQEVERAAAGREEAKGRALAVVSSGVVEQERRAALHMEVFRAFLRGAGGSPMAQAAFSELVELRALSSDSDPSGGYLVAPEQFVNELIKFVDDAVFMRAAATKYRVTNAKSLGIPTLESDPADADWTTELATGNEDTAMAFGKRELSPHPLAKRLKVSKKLLRNSAMNPDQIVMQRLAYKFAVTCEKAYLTGSGAQQPLGVFTASPDGIPTTRDAQTGSATDFTFDGLITAKYTLKTPYWGRAMWAFHRDGVAKIAKLKDTTNQYLWQPSTQAGQPDRLLGFPIMMSEFIPNTFTTGLYVGMLADWSWYYIADALDMIIERLRELYAETNQEGFIGRLETDGMPVLAEAFVRLKTN